MDASQQHVTLLLRSKALPPAMRDAIAAAIEEAGKVPGLHPLEAAVILGNATLTYFVLYLPGLFVANASAWMSQPTRRTRSAGGPFTLHCSPD